MAEHHTYRLKPSVEIPLNLGKTHLHEIARIIPRNYAEMFKFKRIPECKQIDVMNVITENDPSSLFTRNPFGFNYGPQFLQLILRIDHKLFGQSIESKTKVGPKPLFQVALLKLCQTLGSQLQRVDLPPTLENLYIMNAFWSTQTHTFGTNSITKDLSAAYYHSHHRAYHTRLSVSDMRNLNEHNSMSLANPAFSYAPLGEQNFNVISTSNQIVLADWIDDINLFRKSRRNEDQIQQRRTLLTALHTPSGHKISAPSIGLIILMVVPSHVIIDLVQSDSPDLLLFTDQLKDWKFEIIICDKFHLHGTPNEYNPMDSD